MAKGSHSSTRTVLLIVAAIAAVLYFFTSPDSSNKQRSITPPVPAKQEKFTLEKTGAGTVADFSAAAQKVHTAVDEALTAQKVTLKSWQEQKREVPRQAVEGVIRWHTRHIALALPNGMTAERFRQVLVQSLAGSAELLATTADYYEGQSVTRWDIGFRDKLEGDTVTLITDKLYIAADKKSAETKDRPPTKERGRLAIIIDDFGYTAEPIAAFTSIDRPLTFAVLPYQPHTQEAAARGLAARHQIILHLPLEPLSSAETSEKITITAAMSDQDIQQTVVKALNNVPGASGVNNHQGSKATADRRVMRDVLSVVKGQQLFFVDSRTSAKSVALETARELNIRSGENDVFLDNSSDIEAIKQQLRLAGRIAVKEGASIVIGHARPATAIALRAMIPELEAEGVRLVFASQLVK